MNDGSRVKNIQEALSSLNPKVLQIEDQSYLHAGHGAAGGHFKLSIASEQFTGLSRVACHRLVYNCLGALMKTDIHALQIELVNLNDLY